VGRVYGTVLVDVDQHLAVELLAEATVPVVVDWLKQHRAIEVLTRDRGGVWRPSRGDAPEAVQVADRLHLLLNLSSSAGKRVEHVGDGAGRGAASPHHRERPAPPDGTERQYTWGPPSALAPHERYLQERLRRGARKALPLWRELKALGYTAAYQKVARFMAALRKLEATDASGLRRARGLTAAIGTGCDDLARLVTRLEQDQAAVEAPPRLPDGQGHTEARSIASRC
jgi:hypothetical protein